MGLALVGDHKVRETKPVNVSWALCDLSNGRVAFGLCETDRINEVIEVSREYGLIFLTPDDIFLNNFKASDVRAR